MVGLGVSCSLASPSPATRAALDGAPCLDDSNVVCQVGKQKILLPKPKYYCPSPHTAMAVISSYKKLLSGNFRAARKSTLQGRIRLSCDNISLWASNVHGAEVKGCV